MTRAEAVIVIVGVLSAFGAPGCSATPTEGASSCTTDADCPSAFPHCRLDMRCWGSVDPVDAGGDAHVDAARLDGGPDAARDAGHALDAGDTGVDAFVAVDDTGTDAFVPDIGIDAYVPPPDMGTDAYVPPPDMGTDAFVPPPDMGTDAFVPPPDMGTDAFVPPPPENCFNGIDDDHNGLTDCADTVPCAMLTCAPSVPTGGWFGPFSGYDGPGAAPACSGLTPIVAYSGQRGPSAAPYGCSACGQAMPGAGAIGCCGGGFRRYSSSTCTGSPTSSGSLTGDGQSTCGDLVGGAASMQFDRMVCSTAPALSQPVFCNITANTMPTTRPALTWAAVGELCGSNPSAAAGCDASHVCVPRPAPGFSGHMCIDHAGDVACPASSGYSVRTVYYTSATDTRTCASCSGGAVTGTPDCPLVLHECNGSDICCDSGGTNRTLASGNSCLQAPTPNSSFEWIRSGVASTTGLSCSPPAGGTPTGSVAPDPATATTVCCTP